MAYKGSSPNTLNGVGDAQLTEGRPELNYTANRSRASPNKFGIPITPLVPYIPFSVPDDPSLAPRAHNTGTMDDAGSEVEDAPIPRNYLVEAWHRSNPEPGANSVHESGGSACTLGDGRLFLNQKRGGAPLLGPSSLRQRLDDIPEIPICPLAHTVSQHLQMNHHLGAEVPTDTSRVVHTVTATCSLNGVHGHAQAEARMEARMQALENKLNNEVQARHVADLLTEEGYDARDAQIAELQERCASMQDILNELIQERYQQRRLEASVQSLNNVANHAAHTMQVYQQQIEDAVKEVRTAHSTLVSEVSCIIRGLSNQITEMKAEYEALATQTLARCPAEPAMSSGTTRSAGPRLNQVQQQQQ